MRMNALRSMAVVVPGVIALVASGCTNGRSGRCECVGSVVGGALDIACGEIQCVGGVGYECTGPNEARAVSGACGPTGNPRPAGTPDFLIIAVSGHCLYDCPGGYNTEYLLSDRTLDAIAQPLLDAGYSVEAIATTDNIYDQPLGAADPLAYGFDTLMAEMQWGRDTLVADWDNPTRIIVVGHSHGTVWAHTALRVMEEWGTALPVDILIDIDGISIGWDDDTATFFIGDGWSVPLQAYARDSGIAWPFDIWRATDRYPVPGLSVPQDIEELVPDTTIVNLEIWSNDLTGVRDRQPNVRLDGSSENIFRARV
jgi:hypothetical protein